jgi:hypothetical protein
MAELSHEQLWHVCLRKPSDFEPLWRSPAIDGERLLFRLQVVPSDEWRCLTGLGRLRESGKPSCRTPDIRASRLPRI